MADKILLKRAGTPGKVPAAGDLTPGELAVNTADGKLYTKRDNGAVKEVGGAPTWGSITGTLSDQADLQSALDGKVGTGDSRLSDAREWTAETVAQAEAEEGTATTRRAWTAQRVRQAIASWWNSVSSVWGRGFVSSADAAAGRAALSVREQLTADRTYFVRTDGSDSNNGLTNTSGGAFLTIQRAVDAAASLDSGIYQTTIKIADGTYTHPVVVGALVGAKPLAISGNEASPENVHINVTGIVITTTDAAARVVVTGVRLQCTVVCLNASPAGSIEYANVIFNAAGSRHVNAQLNGYIGCIGSYTIAGNAPSHATAAQGGKIRLGISTISTTITITGTPNFSQGFIRCGEGPSLLACALATGQPVFVGAATGPRYAVSTNSVINTNGAGASYFPGDAAGTTATGGQYV